ncbi:MAG TPA: stage V sporulation protein AD [Limnochordia bacterium]|nr:stage V sporulation protein AD [Limnochordia bacterium]
MSTATALTRLGRQTVAFQSPPRLIGHYTVVGPDEASGPLGATFDAVIDDPMAGLTTPEKAERAFYRRAVQGALAAARLQPEEIDFFIGGDLMDQITSSTFTARELDIPYLGVFGACSTICEALGLAAMLTDGGFAERVLVGTASHYHTAERQFRYPIELNVQPKATNIRTVTGAAAAVVAPQGDGFKITHATFGRVVDYGLTDANDMGSAMAPAAAHTLLAHFEETQRTPGDYDLILTGDLSRVGQKFFRSLVKEAGFSLGETHKDAGVLIFSGTQKPGAGGSGAACSAVTTLGYVVREMVQGRFRRVLILATGALLSPKTTLQKESIPTIAHGIVLEV